MMVERNEDVRGTAYTVTVDAAEGVTTGISASDRTTTLRALLREPRRRARRRAPPGACASAARRRRRGARPRGPHRGLGRAHAARGPAPGRDRRDRRRGRRESCACPGSSSWAPPRGARGDDRAAHRLPRRARPRGHPASEPSPTARSACTPTPSCRPSTASSRMRAYRDRRAGIDHVALISTSGTDRLPEEGCLVRVHSECITGEAFGSLKCECGPQLHAAMDLIHERGGVAVDLRGQGRGIGLANKLRAYQLRSRASTPWTRTCSWGCRPMRATTPRPPRSSPTWPPEPRAPAHRRPRQGGSASSAA